MLLSDSRAAHDSPGYLHLQMAYLKLAMIQ